MVFHTLHPESRDSFSSLASGRRFFSILLRLLDLLVELGILSSFGFRIDFRLWLPAALAQQLLEQQLQLSGVYPLGALSYSFLPKLLNQKLQLPCLSQHRIQSREEQLECLVYLALRHHRLRRVPNLTQSLAFRRARTRSRRRCGFRVRLHPFRLRPIRLRSASRFWWLNSTIASHIKDHAWTALRTSRS
jgi:hypothetical protein